MIVKLLKDFTDQFKAGDTISVKTLSENSKVYQATDSKGNPFYIPKVLCEPLEPEAPVVTKRSKVFDDSAALTFASPFAKPRELSPEESEILNAMAEGRSPEPAETVSTTSFTPVSGLTVAEKHKALAEQKQKEAQEKLRYTGEPRLQEGQFWLSDLTEGLLPSSGIDHVITCYLMTHWFKDSDGHWDQVLNPKYPWFTDMSVADVPEVDISYMWTPDVLESLVIAYKLNEKLLLTGPPGTGKTTAIKQWAALVNQPYMRFNGKEDMESSSILGSIWLSSGVMEWKDGLMPQALKLGYLVCLDEVFKIPPGIQMAMQSLYEKDGHLLLEDKAGTLYDKMVYPTEYFRLFLTDNVKGTGDSMELYSATQMQDTSTIDRYGITQDVTYLPELKERQMLKGKYPDASDQVIRRIVQFANQVREAYLGGKCSLTMSPRGLLTAMDQIVNLGMPEKSAVSYSFINKISDDTELGMIRQFVSSIW